MWGLSFTPEGSDFRALKVLQEEFEAQGPGLRAAEDRTSLLCGCFTAQGIPKP